LNLHLGSEGFYDACPYCLTEITAEDEKVEEPSLEERIESCEKPASCPYHVGYLCERPAKDAIPDDCMVCKDIVKCMLQNMKK
jgi:hypothetical protein